MNKTEPLLDSMNAEGVDAAAGPAEAEADDVLLNRHFPIYHFDVNETIFPTDINQ